MFGRKNELESEVFKLMIEYSYDAIGLGDGAGKTLYISPSVTRVLGYTQDEFKQLNILDQYHPDDVKKSVALFEGLMKTPGKRIVDKIRFRHKDGSWTWLEFSAVNRLDHPGIKAIVTNFRDITEIEEAGERLQSIIDSMSEGFQIISRDWKYLYVNDSVVQQGKTTRDKLTGRTMMEVYPGIEKTPLFERLRQVMEKRERVSTENEFTYPDGSKGWFLLNIQPVEEGVLVLSSDITARVNAGHKLLASEERFLQIVNNVDDVFFVIAADYSEMLYLSPAFEQIWGMKVEEVYANPLLWADPIVAEDKDMVFAKVGEMIESGNTHGVGEGIPYRIVRRDGTMRWISAKIIPVKDGTGKVYRLAGVARDVTQAKKDEARIKELDVLRNRFIQIVSHQFRTPLSGIRWNLEALLSGEVGKLTKAQKEFIRIAHDRNIDVTKRLGELMIAMDIEEGRIVIEKEDVSLESLVASVLPGMERLCEVRELRCLYEPPPAPLPSVSADAAKIRGVMERMIENAIFYTPKKGEVKVKLERVGAAVRFSVTDTGIGVPKAEQGRVFMRFFRATNAFTAETDRSGLGLYIAKHFISQHGGTIGFSSEEDKGSTFWFELPTV